MVISLVTVVLAWLRLAPGHAGTQLTPAPSASAGTSWTSTQPTPIISPGGSGAAPGATTSAGTPAPVPPPAPAEGLRFGGTAGLDPVRGDPRVVSPLSTPTAPLNASAASCDKLLPSVTPDTCGLVGSSGHRLAWVVAASPGQGPAASIWQESGGQWAQRLVSTGPPLSAIKGTRFTVPGDGEGIVMIYRSAAAPDQLELAQVIRPDGTVQVTVGVVGGDVRVGDAGLRLSYTYCPGMESVCRTKAQAAAMLTWTAGQWTYTRAADR